MTYFMMFYIQDGAALLSHPSPGSRVQALILTLDTDSAGALINVNYIISLNRCKAKLAPDMTYEI